MVPVEVVVIAVLALLAVLALSQTYTLLKGKEQGMAAERKQHETSRNEPLIKTSEPNRHNQSQPSHLARSGGP
jgi:hypothetical protein